MRPRTAPVRLRGVLLGGLAGFALLAATTAGLGVLVERGRGDPPQGLEGPGVLEPLTCTPPTGQPPFTVDSALLVECPEEYDGVRVRLAGEAVRAVLVRGDRAWLHLNDDPYALELGPLPEHRLPVGANSGVAVSVPVRVGGELTYVGDHRARGDLVEVTGVFRLAHPLDGGGPAVHATEARILERGRPVDVPFDVARLLVAAALTAAAASAALLARHRRRLPPA